MDPDNIERYDRQIRLWGQHGQSKCSNSKICLINANSLGTEILKGLCLAGVGSFTILDSHKLTPEDVGCNFLPHSCIGKSRGESAKNMLLDLNDEVSGDVYPLETYLPHISQRVFDCDPQSETFSNDLSFWKQFNCVVASGFLYIDQIVRLSKICWTTNTPMILCKSIGFYGYLKSQIREHLVIETHPDSVLPDFNLDRPFESLREYLEAIDLTDDAHVSSISKYPYLVIVYKCLKQWQEDHHFHDYRLPTSYSEKKELKSIIDHRLKMLRKKKMTQDNEDVEASNNQEMAFENYLEASRAVNSCLTVSSALPDSVKSIFDNPKVLDLSARNVSRFWLIIKALKEFVINKNEGRLPISGSIPDMTSSSEEYIKLQSIYAKKAREDVDNVFGVVQTFMNSSNFSPGSSLYDETKLICKNIRDLRIVHTRPIFEEYEFKPCTLKEENDEDDFFVIGLGLQALDLFFSTYGRLPGCQDDQVETDVAKLRDCIRQMIGKTSNGLKNLDQCLYELCRYGGAELHATSAFIGGCVAQEVIKLVTNQYNPVDDTLVYDAMMASTKSFTYSDVFLGE